jgi:hypothetical protein
MDIAIKNASAGSGEKARKPFHAPNGIFLLIAAIALVVYGLYLYQFKPMITMRLPQHQPLAIDSPPLALTSFQVRAGGEDLVPRSVAFGGDSVYICFAGKPLIQVYSSNLKLLGSFELDRPATVFPVTIALTDSQLVIADTAKGLIAIYDRDGDYLNSVAWYPGRKTRIKATQLSTDGKILTAVDQSLRQISVISLVKQQPYYDFLELIELIPGEDRMRLPNPSCAAIAPEGSIWIGDSSVGKAFIFSPAGDFVQELEQPVRAKITNPVDCAVAYYANETHPAISSGKSDWQPDQVRMHLLDKGTGKVYVYNLSGRLTLVYPQDRALLGPTSIAINSTRREIFITESGNRSVTVFGY